MQNFTSSRALKNTKYLEYIKSIEDSKLPFSFPDYRKIVVEIGFGNGELITRMAHARPRDLFVGIENSEISCIKAAKRAYMLDLKNVFLIYGDAKFLIREVFEEMSIDLILSFYPIPWPKDSQEGHRIFSTEFLKNASTILKTDGKFIIVTDDENYMERIKRNLKDLNLHFTERKIMSLRATKYGRKWKEMGKNSWAISLAGCTSDVKRIVRYEMPHVHLKAFKLEKLEELSTKKFVDSDGIVHFRGLFKGEEGYLLKVIAVDGGFAQTYYLILKFQKDGKWLVRIDDGMKVFKTPAVKKSVSIVGQFLSVGE